MESSQLNNGFTCAQAPVAIAGLGYIGLLLAVEFGEMGGRLVSTCPKPRSRITEISSIRRSRSQAMSCAPRAARHAPPGSNDRSCEIGRGRLHRGGGAHPGRYRTQPGLHAAGRRQHHRRQAHEARRHRRVPIDRLSWRDR